MQPPVKICLGDDDEHIAYDLATACLCTDLPKRDGGRFTNTEVVSQVLEAMFTHPHVDDALKETLIREAARILRLTVVQTR